MNHFRKVLCFFCAAVLPLGVAEAAIQFNIVGASDPLNNRAEIKFSYSALSDTAATFTIEALNLCNFDALITGLALNNPLQNLTGVTLLSATGTLNDSKWFAKLAPNNIGTPQSLGKFDIGVLTGSNFNGGDPQAGIEVGELGVFQLLLNGTGLDDKPNAGFEWNFFEALSSPKNRNDGSEVFVARFQQTESHGGGSDVGIWDGEPVPVSSPVPEPLSSMVWGMLISAGGLVCFLRGSVAPETA